MLSDSKTNLFLLQVVSGGPRLTVKNEKTQTSLEVSEAAPEDTGSYTVIVRNRHGSAQHTVSLGVIGGIGYLMFYMIKYKHLMNIYTVEMRRIQQKIDGKHKIGLCPHFC